MNTKLYFYYPSIEGGGLEKNLFSLMKNNATEILLMLKSSIITAKNNMNK